MQLNIQTPRKFINLLPSRKSVIYRELQAVYLNKGTNFGQMSHILQR